MSALLYTRNHGGESTVDGEGRKTAKESEDGVLRLEGHAESFLGLKGMIL